MIDIHSLSPIFHSLMPHSDKLNIKDQSAQCRTFTICKTGWIENGGKQSLPVKELQKL